MEEKKSKGSVPIRITFVSAGLGNIYRGFEIAASVWYQELKGLPQIQAKLLAGGSFHDATRLWNAPRNGYLARTLRTMGLLNDGCRFEQLSFGFSAFFYLIFNKPGILWLQEATLANSLLRLRETFGFKYKIVFCDGAPVGHAFAKRFDYVIFLHQYAFNHALADGMDAKKCCVIPHLSLAPDQIMNKQDARLSLKISEDKFVIICVAAWNKHHKRIDYLLSEIASLNFKDTVLLLCGQAEQDANILKEEALKLNIDVQWHTFSQKDLSTAYAASDLFVLPSLNEALGAVLIEAGQHGLPVICHHHDAGKFIFGEDYIGLSDLSKKGNLEQKIRHFKHAGQSNPKLYDTKRYVINKFNRKKLVNDFINFISFISLILIVSTIFY